MVEISNNIQQFINGAGFKKLKRAPAALMRGIKAGLRDFEAEIIKTQMSGRPGINNRTGHAAGSWFIRQVEGGYRLATSAFYLTSHQHAPGTKVSDGWIHAKGKYLAIPLNSFSAKAWPRERQDLFPFRSKGGAFLLGSYRKGNSGARAAKGILKVTAEYLLRTKVYIPKRLHILEDYRTVGQDMIRTAMLKELNTLQNGGNIAL